MSDTFDHQNKDQNEDQKEDQKEDQEEDDKQIEAKETAITSTSGQSGSSVESKEGDSSSETTTKGSSMMEKLTRIFSKNFRLSDNKEDEEEVEKLLEEPTVEAIVKYIKSGNCKNAIAMVGAGISTSAGIPDFRSPGSGLYSQLAKYNLPTPECMFDISFFRENPLPFFDLAKELFPGKFDPTPCHYFLKLLNEKKMLLRLYTQNIDTLERVAGIPGEKLVEAHGTFHTSHCINHKCNQEYSLEWMKDKIFSDSVVPKCTKCQSTVKPDVVFFGERLPERFFSLADEDFQKCDLLIIIGTSLTVQPFAALIDNVPRNTPRLLINKTKAGQQSSQIARLLGISSGLDFDSENNYRDVLLLEDCDKGCQQLAEALDWSQDLQNLINPPLPTPK